MSKDLLDKLQEVMEELFVLCVQSGVSAPDPVLYMPRRTVAELYKSRQSKQSSMRQFEMFSQQPIGDRDTHFDMELNYGSLGSCKLRMLEEWNSIKRNDAWDLLAVTSQSVSFLLSMKEAMRAPAGLQRMVNPAIIDYKVEEIVKQFKRIKESMANDEQAYPGIQQYPDFSNGIGEGGRAFDPGAAQD